MKSIDGNLWREMGALLLKEVGEDRYNHWARHALPLKIDGESITIGFESSFIRDKMETLFRNDFAECARKVTNRNTSVAFVADNSLFPNGGHGPAQQYQRMTFANFIVGKSNEVAYLAARRFVGLKERRLAGAMIVCGAPGTGKSHLLQSIRHALDGRNTLWYRCDQFCSQYIYALRNGKIDSLRQKWRSAAHLLIDDIHLLANKSATQEELARTIDALEKEKRGMVFASERAPNDLAGFSQALLTRLRSAIVIRLESPDFMMRLLFLQTLAHKKLSHVSLEYIARRLNANLKDILLCHDEIESRDAYDVDSVKRVIDDYLATWGRKVTLDDIARVTAAHYQVRMADIFQPKRGRTITAARHTCFYLSRKLLGESLANVGAHFGGCSHATVILGCRKVEKNGDPALARLMQKIERELRSLNSHAE